MRGTLFRHKLFPIWFISLRHSIVKLLPLFIATVAWANKVQQVRLSYWDNPTEMTVTWLTMHELDDKTPPFVSYGVEPNKLQYMVAASRRRFIDQSGKDRYTYRACQEKSLSRKKTTNKDYSVGSDDEMSGIYNFRAMNPSKPLRAAVFGEFGKKDGYSLDTLINATQNDQFDMVFHIGDIAWDLDKKDGDTGDDFLNDIQPIAAYVPYHVIAGNHEHKQDFLHYKERFSMPPNGVLDDNQFWSITVGNTHVIGISSEYYGFNMTEEAQKQYEWLVRNLKQNKATWTIVLMHRPMYCSNNSPAGCQESENLMTRVGQPGFPALEPLFNSAGVVISVDIVFWEHQHSYERNWPVYDGKAYPQADLQHYHNSSTPVYIMSGSAGCHDHEDISQKIQQPYTAVMFGDYGYSLLTVISDTLVGTQFVSLNSTTPLDSFHLLKDPLYKPGMLFASRL